MSKPSNHLPERLRQRIVFLAWQDRIPFEQIEDETGLDEDAVIRLMRRELKPGSFKRWRRRVSGRPTKHRKRFAHRFARGDDNS